MKLALALLAVSFAANLALLATFAFNPSLASGRVRALFSTTREASVATPSPTDAPAAATAPTANRANGGQTAVWRTLYSADLPTLIARLRAAGFPPVVIRAIVNRQIELRFADRLDALAAEHAKIPYWKVTARDAAKFFDALSQISREQARVSQRLLADDFFTPPGANANDERRYGAIPKHKIEMVQRIVDDYDEMTRQARNAMQGIMLPIDREKLALLQRERRADLAAVLTPQELEEFELRTSRVAMQLREPLTLMDATEAEFRAIHRILSSVPENLPPPVTIIGEGNVFQLSPPQQDIIDQLKATLGEQRYAEYARAQNMEFQRLARFAENAEVPIDAAVRAFELRTIAAAEANRIYDDPSRSPAEKRASLRALAERMRREAAAIVGEKVSHNYMRAAQWMAMLERGQAFNFDPDGSPHARPPIEPPNARPGASQ